MQIIRNLSEWLDFRSGLSKRSIGFVPTMGSLHKGHGSLIKRAIRENDFCVVSIFVNPTQFNESKDFNNYPRRESEDIELCKSWGVDVLFMPSESELYPEDKVINVSSSSQWGNILEGLHRPKHFNGVLTIVLKLLNIVQADFVYFGEKDYQQCKLVEQMIRAFFIKTNLVICPTCRDGNLPLSSRNLLLTFKGLREAKKAIDCAHNSKDPVIIKKYFLEKHISFDYIEKYQERIFLAWWIDGVRLIDNFGDI